jgi:hypothetical protein
MFTKLVLSTICIVSFISVLSAEEVVIPEQYRGTYHAVERVLFQNNITVKSTQIYMNQDIFTFYTHTVSFNGEEYELESITVEEYKEDLEWVRFRFKGFLKTFDIMYIGGDTYLFRILLENSNKDNYLIHRTIKRDEE